MINKKIWLWILTAAFCFNGCGQAQSANPSTADKAQAAQNKKASPKTHALPMPEGSNTSLTYRTPDMPAYHWPADFKLPLIINVEVAEVPAEIKNPSPPIVEDKIPDKEATGSATHE